MELGNRVPSPGYAAGYAETRRDQGEQRASAGAQHGLVGGFPEAAPDGSRSTLTTEEHGNLEQLWLVVEKLQPDHAGLMQQVTAK